MTCSCGEAADHIVMTRRTADGIIVNLWSDGAVTGALGYGLRDVPMRRPASDAARTLALTAGRLLLGEACVHDHTELGPVYRAAERAARGDGLPGTLRRHLRESAPIRLGWTVLHADRDGTPTERVCRLPRLRWPGLVVWDFCGGPGSRDGRYVVMTERDGTCAPTGMAFRRLPDLFAYLETIAPPAFVSAGVTRG